MISNSDDPDVIERDLAETRARMDQRIDELQEKLSPGQVVNETISYFGGGENGSEAADKLLSLAKANPIPAALIGAGLGWLAVERFAPRRKGGGRTQGQDVTGSGFEGGTVGPDRDPEETDAAYEWRARKLQHSGGTGKVQAVKGAAKGLAGKITNSSAAGRLRSSASHVDTPIVLGGVTALIGAVAGALLPLTEREEEMLRPTVDDLRATGSDLGQRLMERGTQAAR